MLPPPPDPGVDPDEEEGMLDIAEAHQDHAGADQRPAPAGALVHG